MTVTSVEPSAPPIDDDEIPVVTATAIPVADDQSAFPSASATAFNISDSQSAPATAVPTAPLGMSMVTKTITYPDGRKVTTTEYVPSSIAAPAPAAAAAAAPNRQHHPPRRDLGSNASSVTCPYCQHTGLTRTNQQCGECTWISAIILVLFCFPLAWIPFVCPSCYDTEHYCRQCGKVIGWSRADCCSKK